MRSTVQGDASRLHARPWSSQFTYRDPRAKASSAAPGAGSRCCCPRAVRPSAASSPFIHSRGRSKRPTSARDVSWGCRRLSASLRPRRKAQASDFKAFRGGVVPCGRLGLLQRGFGGCGGGVHVRRHRPRSSDRGPPGRLGPLQPSSACREAA